MRLEKGYLYVSELGCHIRVLQHTGTEKCHRLNAELPVQAPIHDLWWNTEWQWVSEDRVSSLTPALFFHPLWSPLKTRKGIGVLHKMSIQSNAFDMFKHRQKNVFCKRILLSKKHTNKCTDCVLLVTSKISEILPEFSTLLLFFALYECKQNICTSLNYSHQPISRTQDSNKS